MKTPKYKIQTIQKFLDYLAESGLTVYGQAMGEDGSYEHGCMDYNAKDILERRNHIQKGTIGKREDLKC